MALGELFWSRFCTEERRVREARLRDSTRINNTAWTATMSSLAGDVAAECGLYCASKNAKDGFARSEYFNLDVVMMERGHPRFGGSEVSYPMPAITMEYENQRTKVLYDYWKLLCVRSKLRVLVFILPNPSQDAAPVLKDLALLRQEHDPLGGEDCIVIGPENVANTDAALVAHFWRHGEFRELPLE